MEQGDILQNEVECKSLSSTPLDEIGCYRNGCYCRYFIWHRFVFTSNSRLVNCISSFLLKILINSFAGLNSLNIFLRRDSKSSLPLIVAAHIEPAPLVLLEQPRLLVQSEQRFALLKFFYPLLVF